MWIRRVQSTRAGEDERYGVDMPVARQPPQPIEPIRRLEDLDEYFGNWVAIRGAQVVAFADTSRALAYELHKLGTRGQGAVMRYVAEPSHSVVVGLG